MKIGILHQDGVAALNYATIYKIQIISQTCLLGNMTRFTNWTAEDYSNFESENAITWLGDFSPTGELLIDIPGLLIEFPEPINNISVSEGAVLVYYDDYCPIPEDYR